MPIYYFHFSFFFYCIATTTHFITFTTLFSYAIKSIHRDRYIVWFTSYQSFVAVVDVAGIHQSRLIFVFTTSLKHSFIRLLAACVICIGFNFCMVHYFMICIVFLFGIECFVFLCFCTKRKICVRNLWHSAISNNQLYLLLFIDWCVCTFHMCDDIVDFVNSNLGFHPETDHFILLLTLIEVIVVMVVTHLSLLKAKLHCNASRFFDLFCSGFRITNAQTYTQNEIRYNFSISIIIKCLVAVIIDGCEA